MAERTRQMPHLLNHDLLRHYTISMNQILSNITWAGFLLLPLVMLCLRAVGPKWFTGPVALLIMALLGWFLINAGIHFYFESLGDRMRAYGGNPPQQLAEEWANDGAKQVFAVLLGGFYSLTYYAPFALIYEVVRGIKRLCKPSNGSGSVS